MEIDYEIFLRLKLKQVPGLLHDLGVHPAGAVSLVMSPVTGCPGLINVYLTKEQSQKLRSVISDEQIGKRYDG